MFDGRDLLTLSDEQMREIRGRDISMIFQEPMTSLNPVLPIGQQIMEPLLIHLKMTEDQARARALELLQLVGITDGERRLEQYPHHLSGGMRQRVMIAIGLACNPKLIIADEPTTALDVTIQAQILELMKDLSRRLDIALIIITHNLGVVARYADRVNVMYAARIVEQGTADDVFLRPRHPYTIGLMRSVPRLDLPRGIKLETIEGLPPDLRSPPTGCRFAPRCPFRIESAPQDPALARPSRPVTLGLLARRGNRRRHAGLRRRRAERSPRPRRCSSNSKPLLVVDGPEEIFRRQGGGRRLHVIEDRHREGGGRCLVHDRGRARRSGWSANPAAARPRSAARSSLEEPTAGTIRFGGADITHARAMPKCGRCGARSR